MKQFKIMILFAVLLISKLSYAGFFEEKKTVSCAYKVSANPTVEIENQYGSVQIITWDKDSVKLEAAVLATSDKVQDIQKLMAKVEVLCRGTQSTVMFSTEWTDGVSFLNKGSMDLKNILNSDKKLTVNYIVYLPANSRLSIKNRFGDIYLPNYIGALRIDLSHGDLRARDINDARSIAVKYGKVIIKNLEQGILSIDYGTLILDKAKIITLESKSSTIEILEADRLAIRSKNDELRIDKVNSLRGEAYFSHVLVKNLQKLLDLKTNYGDVNLKEISKDFELIRLDGSNTDYDLEFLKGGGFQFTVETLKQRGFSHPDVLKIISEEESDKDLKLYKGYLGSETAAATVNINQKSGYLSFYFR